MENENSFEQSISDTESVIGRNECLEVVDEEEEIWNVDDYWEPDQNATPQDEAFNATEVYATNLLQPHWINQFVDAD